MKARSLTIALTTVADGATADRITRTLLEERLVGCINRVPVQSSYWWQGCIEQGEELLLVMKTADDLIDDLRQRIQELSPYQVPEFVALPDTVTTPSYLAWLLESCPVRDRVPR